ncbi:uncharacterized protein LOC141627515 [Silene latifolia]|uniref:uncharacterized protein LOC141627515 n=1 Tax=Silene latifolia TaxID=37657 RepID=UPI003D784600
MYARVTLLTKQRLLKYGVMCDGLCCICASSQETQDRLFFDCQFSLQCLQLVSQWLGLQWPVSSLADLLNWRCKSLLKKQVMMASIASLVYHIWLSRNKARHEGSVPRPGVVLHQVQDMVKYRL